MAALPVVFIVHALVVGGLAKDDERLCGLEVMGEACGVGVRKESDAAESDAADADASPLAASAQSTPCQSNEQICRRLTTS